MSMQLTNISHDYAGGGNWITWAYVTYRDAAGEVTLRGTLAFGCGYVNFWVGLLGWDDICGMNPVEPSLGYDLRDIEWQWSETGDLVDNFGNECFAIDVPHEPYNFNADDLGAISEACEALWHYHKFKTLQRP